MVHGYALRVHVAFMVQLALGRFCNTVVVVLCDRGHYLLREVFLFLVYLFYVFIIDLLSLVRAVVLLYVFYAFLYVDVLFVGYLLFYFFLDFHVFDCKARG